ncbi:MAG: YdeI/OmpD-associated family protein, partial [Chloroflexota bacterium]|nr:YdeI/OmpD-associated family protein [Chloroflexota bacterium]
ARRADRTGIYAFEQAPAVLSAEFEARLRDDPAAFAFLEAQPAGYRQTFIHWSWTGSRRRPDYAGWRSSSRTPL